MASAEQQPESLNTQLLVDSIPALIHTARPDGHLDYFNKPWLEYLGVTLDKVAGWNWTDVIHPEDVKGIVAKWRACLATGESFEYETRVRRADGEYRWMFHRKVPLRDANGNIVKWYGSSMDIEERKRVEDALRLSEAYMAQAQQLASVGSWAYKPPDICEHWSAGMFRIFGFDSSKGYPPNDEIANLVHPEDRQRADDALTQLFKHGQIFDQKYRYMRPDGQLRVIRDFGTPVFENGVVTRFVGACLDVTEQELRIEEIRRSEFYLAEGQRLAHIGSWAFDPSGFFEYWSRELFQIYGLDPEKGAPTLEQYLGLVHPQDRAFMARTIERMSAESLGCDIKKRIVRPDGELRYIRCVGIPIVDSGILKRILGSAIDVTEHELLTQELRRREAYLVEAQRLSHTGSFGWSVSSGEILWSDETFRIFECDRSTKPTVDFVLSRVHRKDRDLVQQQIDRASRDGEGFDFEHRLQLPDGSIKHVRVTTHPSRDSAGNLEFVGALTDITERKTAEEALRSSEGYLAEAQRLSHTGSWAWNPDQDIRYWSEECYRVLGFDPRDGVPRMEEFIQRIHPDDQPAFRESAEGARHNKLDEEVDYRIVHPGGAVRDIHSIGHPVFSPSGDLIEYTGTVIDVTERKRAEEERSRSEMELRQIVDLVPQLIAVYGPNSERLYTNRTALDYLGIGLDEWRQKKFGASAHPDDSERLKTRADRAFSSGAADELELRLRKRDGSYRWFLARFSPLRDEHGQVVRWYFTATDIDDRKQAEDKLRQENVALKRAEEKIREQEMELRQMLEFTPQLVAVFGPNRERLFVNRIGLDYLGISLDEWRQSSVAAAVHPDDWERLKTYADPVLSNGTASELELQLRKADGSYRWFLARYNPLHDDKGQIIRWYVACTDIEDRKQAEEKVRRSEDELRQLIDVIPQQVFVFGADWSPLFANRRELEYTGLTPEEAQSKDAVARVFHPEDLEKLEGLRERARQQNDPFEMEARIKGRNGEYRWFLIRDNPLRDEQGRTIRWYGTRTDIEERKQADEKLRQAHAELARVARVVTMGELAASIAHEVNQPISGMVMNGSACLRWLAGDSPNLDEARENARRIVRDGKRAGEVIARVRALATKTATEKVRLDTNELTREVIALAQSEAHRNGVTLRTEFASDLWPVLGDRVELQQVVLNLVMNGVESMRTVGNRPRELVIRTQNDEADKVRVTVQDSGIGLDPKSVERIFEAFYTTKQGGMGMGLSISRSIVEHHGGRLWAVANDGPGTTFQFTVPKYH